jgi:hypothetical protein
MKGHNSAGMNRKSVQGATAWTLFNVCVWRTPLLATAVFLIDLYQAMSLCTDGGKAIQYSGSVDLVAERLGPKPFGRLAHMSDARLDFSQSTIRFQQGHLQVRFESFGVGAGWRCLEVGASGGSIAEWLCGKVGPHGRVVATDLQTMSISLRAGEERRTRQMKFSRKNFPCNSALPIPVVK